MIRATSLVLSLAALWLLLSGHYEPLTLAFMLLSVSLVALTAWRMRIADVEGQPVHMLGAALLYWPWLLLEIFRSNLAVARAILDPRLPISPCVFDVRPTQKSDLGRVIFANSITLTPGTVSLEVEAGRIRVHALTSAGAAAFDAGEMDQRVSALEGR